MTGVETALPARRRLVAYHRLTEVETARANSGSADADASALIAALGEELGWSKRALARKLGVTHAALRKWERGGIPGERRSELERLYAGGAADVDLAALRGRLGWTQEQLARRLGKHWRTVARWEAGEQRPPAAMREALRALEAGAPGPVAVLRARLGLTQEELARELGVSGSLVGAWESGRAVVPARHQGRLAELEAADAAPAGAWIETQRLARGFSRGQLAKRVGVPRARIGEWEKGERPVPPRYRQALRRALSRRAPRELDRAVLELVRAEPGLSRAQLAGRFPADDLGALQGALSRHVAAGRLFRAQGAVRDRTGRPLRVWRYYDKPHRGDRVTAVVTGARLRRWREEKGWMVGAFARALDVSRAAVRFWERLDDRPIPASRQAAVVELLGNCQPPPPPARPPRERLVSAMPDLRQRRRVAGLKQAELAGLCGVVQSTISAWELGRIPVSPAAAARLEGIFAACAEPVTGEQLRAGRERAGWRQRDLAARLGVKADLIQRWESGRSAIPARFRDPLRSLLAHAPAAERSEPMPDLRPRREALGWTQRHLAGLIGVSPSLVSQWELGKPVPPAMIRRLEREFARGTPVPDRSLLRRTAAAERLRVAIVALVAAEPGLSRRQVMERVGADWSAVRDAIAALAAASEVHRRSTRYVDRAGRERFRLGLHAGASSERQAPVFDGPELARRRDELGWSQAELARRLGISQTVIWRWEHGKVQPAPDQVAQLEELLAAAAQETDRHARERLPRVEALLAPTRAGLGLSVSEMARRLGVDRGTYAVWEAGERPVSSWRRLDVLAALDQLEAPAGSDAAAVA